MDAARLPLFALQAAALGTPLTEALAAWWRDAPRLSLRDILAEASPAAEFEWRRQLRREVARHGEAPSSPIVPDGIGTAGVCWDVVCVTARLPVQAEAYKK